MYKLLGLHDVYSCISTFQSSSHPEKLALQSSKIVIVHQCVMVRDILWESCLMLLHITLQLNIANVRIVNLVILVKGVVDTSKSILVLRKDYFGNCLLVISEQRICGSMSASWFVGLYVCMYNCTNIGAIAILLCVTEMALVNFAILCTMSLILT